MRPRTPNSPTFPNPLVVRIINVGQGQCILLDIPGPPHCYGLIDCYSDPRGEIGPRVLEFIEEGQTPLEFVVITHPDKDHILGLSKVFDYFDKRTGAENRIVYEGPGRCLDRAYRTFQPSEDSGLAAATGGDAHFRNEIANLTKRFLKEHKRWVTLPRTKQPKFWIAPGLWCEILLPTQNQREILTAAIFGKPGTSFNWNHASLAMKLIYSPTEFGGASSRDQAPKKGGVLFIGGDAQKGWDELDPTVFSTINIAVVPHHGGHGNPPALWNALGGRNPSLYSIISCGNHLDARTADYKHPFKETLLSMTANKVKIHCTNLGHQCGTPLLADAIQRQRNGSGVTIKEALEKHRISPLRFAKQTNLNCSGDLSLSLSESGEVVPLHKEIICEWGIQHTRNTPP